jgi:hypothetical protein
VAADEQAVTDAGLNTQSEVPDDERVFRRVPADSNYWSVTEGVVRVSSQAFGDRNQRPSVDLASLCVTAKYTQGGNEENGVLCLRVGDIRKIKDVVQRSSDGKTILRSYALDVFPDPIVEQEGRPGNHAHAEIRPSPEYQGKNPFRKAMEALARIATWEILPGGLRSQGNPSQLKPSSELSQDVNGTRSRD